MPETHMAADMRSPSVRHNPLKRLVFIVLYALVFNVVELVLSVIVLIQYGTTVVRARPLNRLLTFSEALAAYVQQIVRFFTYLSDEVPWPFAPWPSAEMARAAGAAVEPPGEAPGETQP